MTAIDGFNGEYAFLSNFASCVIVLKDKVWPTVEHAYQASKSLDPEDWERIRQARTAGEAKKLGREVVLRTDWDYIKDWTMYRLLQIKFENDWMREHLLETGDAVLIEGNTWHDQYWGDCKCGRRSCQLEGKNRLGELLMQVREEIRERNGTV